LTHPGGFHPLLQVVHPFSGLAPSGYSPAQIRHAYNFDGITLPGGGHGDGSGQTIAIVDAFHDPNITSDLHHFDQQFGLSDPALSVVAQDGSNQYPPTDPTGGWEMEESLDVEWAHAMAPGATILLVEATDNSDANLMAAVTYAAAQPHVSVVSMSWGGSEDPSQVLDDSQFTTPGGHAGVTFVASSGDQGTVSYPATSPNVLSVGGTTLRLDGNNNISSETAWFDSGGGLSQVESLPSYQQSALGGSARGNPDVAYDADPNTGFAVYDSFANPGGPWTKVGGTSAGAPQWAALIAIANQGRALNHQSSLDGPSQTLPLIYGLSGSGFHDITSGSNAAGYSAGTGYDLVTGWGSPNAAQVVATLTGQPQTTGSLSATGQNFNATAGTSFTGVVAVIHDTLPGASATVFQVTINWGDGGTSSGSVTANADGSFNVTGTHTYGQGGNYTVKVQIEDAVNTQTTTAQASATVAAAATTIAPQSPQPVPQPLPFIPVQPTPSLTQGIFVAVLKVKGQFQVLVFSTTTGALLTRLTPFSQSVHRQPQVLPVDINGDGVPDWVVIAQQGKHTVIFALSGVDGSVLLNAMV
jgi:subtilase family serine protease